MAISFSEEIAEITKIDPMVITYWRNLENVTRFDPYQVQPEASK
jgi:hypothetical protein